MLWGCSIEYPENILENKEKHPKSYDFGCFLGGDDRTRICDPLRVKQVLYRLSYASI